MLDAPITYGFAGIAATSEDLQGSSVALGSQIDDLSTTVTNLQNSYTGAGADGLQNAHRQWNAAATDAKQILAKLAGVTGDAGVNMNARDMANGQRYVGG